MRIPSKRPRRLASCLFFGLVMSCSSNAPADSPSGKLRPADLVKSPKDFLDHNVDLEIIEPLSGPATPQNLATAEYGRIRIEIPDAMGTEISLVPSAFRVEDPNRYHRKFDRVMASPIRVKGEFLIDPEMTQSMHRPVYVIRVASWEPMAREAAVALPSLAEVKANPAKWDRKRIVYEGIYETRFEVAALDKDIWLAFEPNAEVAGTPVEASPGRRVNRVRVTGTLYSNPNVRYGHLGGYPFELQASKIEYLGAAALP
ncbi:MAG: hypothetical protein K8R69_09420 [Deltaproteobacteria bacterium]|nr:hypothetical protein [Deltaproteobacteria bacterium]